MALASHSNDSSSVSAPLPIQLTIYGPERQQRIAKVIALLHLCGRSGRSFWFLTLIWFDQLWSLWPFSKRFSEWKISLSTLLFSPCLSFNLYSSAIQIKRKQSLNFGNYLYIIKCYPFFCLFPLAQLIHGAYITPRSQVNEWIHW